MPKLVFKLSDNQSLDFPLAGDHVRLGRNAANDIVIDNSWISSFHAEFRLGKDGVIEVRDLHSSNGTTVNGTRIETARLSPGDTIGFGQLEATFDPVPEGLAVPAATPIRAMKPESAPPPAPLKGPRLAKPVTQPVQPLPRAADTQPVVSSRSVTPANIPATAPVPSEAVSADVRHELQQSHAELAAARAELKSLAGQVEALRRDRDSEEQSQAQLRLQGEREARELRSRLDKLQEDLERTETAAADSAKARTQKLSAEEQAQSARLAGLHSAAESVAAAVKAQEQRLAALKNEEAGLATVSSKLQSALQEAADLEKRNAAAASATAELESKAAAAAENLRLIQSQIGDAAGSLTAKETELSSLLSKLDISRIEAGAAAARLAEPSMVGDVHNRFKVQILWEGGRVCQHLLEKRPPIGQHGAAGVQEQIGRDLLVVRNGVFRIIPPVQEVKLFGKQVME